MILVIGIGNPDRGDDAAGLAVASRLRKAAAPGHVTVQELIGDQLALLDAWTGASTVYLVDAVCSGGTPGTVYRFDAADTLTAHFRHRGTHTFSLADVIELARALDRLPRHLAGFGIEGATWELGAALSPQAEAAVQTVTSQLLKELAGALAMCLGTTGVITAVRDDDGVLMALVDTGLAETVLGCLVTCPEAGVGDTVLVHSGFVLQILDAHQEDAS